MPDWGLGGCRVSWFPCFETWPSVFHPGFTLDAAVPSPLKADVSESHHTFLGLHVICDRTSCPCEALCSCLGDKVMGPDRPGLSGVILAVTVAGPAALTSYCVTLDTDSATPGSGCVIWGVGTLEIDSGLFWIK